jgi:small neutral amino acid transporter SnatA (MarC family)
MRREGQAAEEAVEKHVRNIAAFPLAIPLMAGPGAITATVLLAGRAFGHMLLVGLLLAVVVFVSLACLVAFLLAGRLGSLLGLTGNIVLSRLLGVVLAALAVQYVDTVVERLQVEADRSIFRRTSRMMRPSRVRRNLSSRRARLNWWACV